MPSVLSRSLLFAALGGTALVLATCATPGPTPSAAVPPTAAADTTQAVAPPPSPPTPAPPPIPREFRGVWITPVEGGEWPSRRDLSSDQQRTELVALLDRVRDLNLNAVIFHVRTGADALYPSARGVPWSAYLTGHLGQEPSPPYDPLAFAIEQAHARGLQFHAWFNPFRVSSAADARHTPGDIATEHPKWIVRYGDQLWIDPGIPEARQTVLNDILEVVDRYDIDAVHLDDYFYPYLEVRTIHSRVRVRVRRHHYHYHRVTKHVTLAFADNASWKKYGATSGWEDRASWRRDNIDSFIRDLYRTVKAHKPWVQVGISPFGIWRPDYPDGITGLDAYAEIFADSRRWLREGWLDYLAPQLYWPLDNDQQRFTRLAGWWQSQNRMERNLWPGLFTDRAASGYSRWPSAEIPAEIDTLRARQGAAGESLGHVHFRLKSLLAFARGDVGELLRHGVYREPAVPPASPWLGATPPARPQIAESSSLLVRAIDAILPGKQAPTIDIAPGDTVPVRWWVVQLQGADGRWTTTIRPGTDRRIPLALPNGSEPRAAAISGLSNTGVAGPRAVVQPEQGGTSP